MAPQRLGRTVRRVLIFLATMSLAVGLFVGAVLPANAAMIRAFTPIFTANTNGDIILRGNSLLTCAASTSCTTAQTGGGGANNNFDMIPIDVDADVTTFNSSSATITIPAGATVLYAGLSWGATTTAGTSGVAAPTPTAKDRVVLKAPGGSYATVISSATDGSTAYQGFADVTATVLQAGSGSYTVGNVQAGTGRDRYAGWSMAIAYRLPTAPPRNLVIYTGYGSVTGNDATLPIPVSGFTTPPTGPVVTRLGVVAYEGDKGNLGDSLTLGSTALSNSRNPANDVMNSTLSDVGTLVSNRTPAYGNMLGFDIDRLDATGILANGATSTTITVTTANPGGETYYPGLLTFATDLYAPEVTAVKSVVDANGGTVAPGDLLNYRVNVANAGGDAATTLVLADAVPTGTSYVAGSLTIGGAAATDQAGDDPGEVTGTGVTARLGTGATSTTGGSLTISTSVAVAFQVRVGAAASDGAAITNTATLAYRSQATGSQFTGASNLVTSTVVVPPTLTCAPPPPAQVGTTYSNQLTRTGGTGPYVWSVSAGSLPAGLSLDGSSGLLSGTPTAAGSRTFTVRIVDANGRVDTREVTLVVAKATSTLSLTTSDSATSFGTPVTLVAPAGPGSPTGTVTFSNVASSGPDSGVATTLGTGTLDNGSASLTVAMPALGLNTITATYGGDGSHEIATSAPVTVEVSAVAGEVIVTEFRSSGPEGADDSYVELLNTGPRIPLAGFTLTSSSGSTLTLPATTGTVGTNRSFLVAGSSFSLDAVSNPDAVGSLGSGGLTVQAPDTATTVTDQVGPSSGPHLGTGLPALTGSPTAQHAWVRAEVAGRAADSRDNAADFRLVSTTGGTIGGVQSMLGSPSPTGLADPYQHNAQLQSALLDPSVDAAAAPNRVSTPGRLVIRRTITNTSPTSTVVEAKLRVTALSEANGAPRRGASEPARRANLRAVEPDTASQVVSLPGGGSTTVLNLEVDAPSVALGGGMNSTLTVPLPDGLAPGASIAVAVTFDVDTRGTFWFGYDVDAVGTTGVIGNPLRAKGADPQAPSKSDLSKSDLSKNDLSKNDLGKSDLGKNAQQERVRKPGRLGGPSDSGQLR